MSTTNGRFPNDMLEFCQSKDLSQNEQKKFYQPISSKYEEIVIGLGYTGYVDCGEVFDAAVKKIYQQRDKTMQILDIGAGTGLLGAWLKERGYTNIDAIDGCDDMLQEAKAKNVYNKILVSFIDEKKNEEIKDGEYDCLVTSGAISMPQIQARAFDEMLRWLKKGGLFCFTLRMKDYELESLGYKKKLQKLEEEKKWKLISQKDILYVDQEKSDPTQDLPFNGGLVFVYQKL